MLILTRAGNGFRDTGIPPDAVPNLTAWYRSDLGVTVDGGSGRVTAWADQSGNGYTLAKASPSGPLFSAGTGPNGTDELDFDLKILDNASLPTANGFMTWMVFKAYSYSGSHVFQTGGSGNDLYLSGTAQEVQLSAGSGATGTWGAPLNNWGLGRSVHVTGNNGKVALNDAGYDTGVGCTTSSTTQIDLGGNRLEGAKSDFGLAEFVIYSAEVTGDNLAGLLTYFNSRYALW